MKFLVRKVISGCAERGDAESYYLVRFTIIENRWGALYLHVFRRSDSPEHHDHPWHFVSLILWRGYKEETPLGLRRYWPGQVLFRNATWRHRVVLVDEKPAVTLVLRTKYIRDWGFFTSNGWERWQSYFKRLGC